MAVHNRKEKSYLYVYFSDVECNVSKISFALKTGGQGKMWSVE